MAAVVALCMFFSGTIKTISTAKVKLVTAKQGKLEEEIRTFLLKLPNLPAEGVVAVGGERTEAGARLAEMRDFFAFLEVEVPALVERWHEGRTAR